MLRHHFLSSFRYLQKNKVYSLLNIGGLAAGISIALLVALWINDELSYNKYHENYDRIVKVLRKNTQGEISVSDTHVGKLGELLNEDYPSLFKHVVLASSPKQHVLSTNEKTFTQTGIFIQDGAPELLSLKMKKGRWDGLKDLNSIMLSESLATKLFGDKDPINQFIKVNAEWTLLVTGVYEDLPKNSSFAEASFFSPIERYYKDSPRLYNWRVYSMNIYAELLPNVDIDVASETIEQLMNQHSEKAESALFLQPMSDWHLYSSFENGSRVMSESLKFIWFYGLIGTFVLLLACINFMNLSTAKSTNRAKEIGVRKVLGSKRSQLVYYFLSESIINTFLAFLLSIIVATLLLPWFNDLAYKSIKFPWANLSFWLYALIFIGATSFIAGSYPAIYLSSLAPTKALKRKPSKKRVFNLRKVLVVVQYTISISLIIGTLVVRKQIEFAKNRSLGYNQQGLLTVNSKSPDFAGKFELLRSNLISTGVVSEVAEADHPLTTIRGNNNGFDWNGRPEESNPMFNTVMVSPEYGKTVGWNIIEGRDFSREFSPNRNSIILSESAVKVMGLENPVGERIRSRYDYDGKTEFTVIGVIQDMVKESPFDPPMPAIIFPSENDMEWLFIRLNTAEKTASAINKIDKVFVSVLPNTPVSYELTEDVYSLKFQAEERLGKLVGFFSALAIFISCLGLFGMASYMAEKRSKEIGIRKILGASTEGLWVLLSKDFGILILIACLISSPLAYKVLDNWLQGYEVRTELSWWLFVVAGLSAVLITLASVSIQTFKIILKTPLSYLKED